MRAGLTYTLEDTVKTILTSLILSLGLASSAAYAADNDWSVDTSHSSAVFTVRHMMVSNLPGQMGGVKGKVEFDGKNPKSIQVSATIDPSTINTADAGRDEHLRSKDFFDVKTFPAITFESTGVTATNKGGFKLAGKLTLHGVTKNVELDVDGPTEPLIDSKKGIEKIGATATTTINRQEFGITYNSALDHGGVAVSDEVKITLNLELSRKMTEKIGSL